MTGEEPADGFVAYPVGLRGVIVGQGDALDEAVAGVTSAIKFRVETFGSHGTRNGSAVSPARPTLDANRARATIFE